MLWLCSALSVRSGVGIRVDRDGFVTEPIFRTISTRMVIATWTRKSLLDRLAKAGRGDAQARRRRPAAKAACSCRCL